MGKNNKKKHLSLGQFIILTTLSLSFIKKGVNINQIL